MADINPLNKIPARPQKGLYLRKQDLRRGIELMFFAYRDFTGEADDVLAELGLGRAHHRVIYFVGRQPNMTVSDLLTILKITKQSLSRVLSHLIAEGYIHQEKGARDKRQHAAPPALPVRFPICARQLVPPSSAEALLAGGDRRWRQVRATAARRR